MTFSESDKTFIEKMVKESRWSLRMLSKYAKDNKKDWDRSLLYRMALKCRFGGPVVSMRNPGFDRKIKISMDTMIPENGKILSKAKNPPKAKAPISKEEVSIPSVATKMPEPDKVDDKVKPIVEEKKAKSKPAPKRRGAKKA